MDLNQQLELKSNQQPSQDNYRSRRCHSRLADALEYVQSQQLRDASNDEHVTVSPRRALSDELSPVFREQSLERVASVNSMFVNKTETQKNVSRTYPKVSAKVDAAPKTQSLDMTSDIGSALSSPDPSIFTTANRVSISSSPFSARAVSPLNEWQLEKQLKASYQKMEPSQNKNTFDYSEIGEETNDDPKISDEKEDKLNAYMKKHEEERLHDILPREMKIVIEKQEKEEDQRVKSVQAEHSLTSYSEIKPIVLKRNNGITESGDNSPESHSVSQTYTDNSGKAVDLPSNGMPSNPKTPKPMVPPFHPKGHIVVRETRASRLRKYRLQMENDLDDVQNVLPAVKARDKHPVKDSLAKSHRRTLSTSTAKGRPRPGFHPPLKFHTPGDYPNGDLIPPPDFAVRETKASKLRRLKKLEDEKREQETLKDMTFDIQVKPLQRQRSPPPTFKPAPPKPYKKPEPVFIKETRASKLRKQREIEEVNNKGTLKRDRTLYGTQQTNAKEIPSKSITVQDKERKNREVKRPKTAKAPRLLPTISQNPDEQLSENVSVNQLPKDSTQTGRRTVYRTSTTASDNNTLSTDKTSLKISTPISQKQRASVDITTSRLFEVDKMQQRKCRTPDWSARDRLCRLKVERGLEVGKKIRTAMEEDEKNWQAELISEFENVERPFLFGKADDETKRLVKEALCILRECLEASDTTETSKSKVKSFLSNKFKEYFTNKNRAGRDNIKNGHLRKKREEKINAYFGRTVQSLNRVLIDVWERFNDQQDTYRQMLEKITLLEEMLKKWKSEAKHHRFMHTMLKKDYLEGRKENWYL